MEVRHKQDGLVLFYLVFYKIADPKMLCNNVLF